MTVASALSATERRWFPDTAAMSVGPAASGVVAAGSLQSFVVWAREGGPPGQHDDADEQGEENGEDP